MVMLESLSGSGHKYVKLRPRLADKLERVMWDPLGMLTTWTQLLSALCFILLQIILLLPDCLCFNIANVSLICSKWLRYGENDV